MADKLMYPIGSFRYGNRMMKAGDDPVMMNGRDQRLYAALKVASPDAPAKVATTPPVTPPRAVTTAPKPKRKAPAKKKAAKKK